MAAAPAGKSMVVDVRGISLEVTIHGTGRDILFLNSGSWLADESPFIAHLATLGRVIAPTHPGFGNADVPSALTTVDDLAYLYLDLIDEMKLHHILLVGASFGAWIAGEMMVKGAEQVSALAVFGPFGVKAGSREERMITDMFATPDKEIQARSYVTPQNFHRDIQDLSDAELTRRIRAREALARFGWSPYMHDPKLPSRLHRSKVPAAVFWGEKDRMVSEACARLFAESLPNSRFVRLENAAHLLHLEQPEQVLRHLRDLPGGNVIGQSQRPHEAV